MKNVWESRWRSGDTGWDHGEAAPPLIDYLRNNRIEGRILVPGCGSGHDVRALAAASPRAQVIGLDLAPSAIATARTYTARGNLQWRVGDFLALPPHDAEAFDVLFEHTCFCALEPGLRPRYVEAVDFALRPGGLYLAIFYLNPISEQGPPFRVSPAELEKLFNRFELLERWVPTVGYPSRLGREEMRLYRKVSAPV